MKKIIIIVLILLVIIASAYSQLFLKKDKVDYEDIKFEEELITELEVEEFEEGNIENSGGASTVYVEGIEKINDFLDLDMMLKYKDLITAYGLLLPRVVNNDTESYYQENEELLRTSFGIYSYSDFEVLNSSIQNSELNKEHSLNSITISKIEQEGNLLKVESIYKYGEVDIELSHFISYVFIKGEPELFIYQ